MISYKITTKILKLITINPHKIHMITGSTPISKPYPQGWLRRIEVSGDRQEQQGSAGGGA